MFERCGRSAACVITAFLSSGGAAHPAATLGARTGTAPPPPVQIHSMGGVGSARQRAHLAYESMALTFVPNAGQTDARVRFQAQVGGASFYFTPKEAVFALTGKDKGHVLRLGFVGANAKVEIEGARKGAAKVNYFRGGDPARWRAGVSTYEEVVYRELWPGIDLAFRGEAGTLKYEFRLAPGADPAAIRLSYQGAERLSVGEAGDLRIETPLGVIADSAPVSYQLVGGERVPIDSPYAVAGTKYAFGLGRYDRRRPLVIDPGLAYSTYLGATGNEGGFGIAVDGAGNAYVTGFTSSGEFPTTAGAFDASLGGEQDAFVTKLGPAGTALLYSTFLGGSGSDTGRGIAVDALGNAYVTGNTTSSDFPTTVGAFDTSLGGARDGFVTKLGPSGTALLYSTYLGGSGGIFGSTLESGEGIAVDGAGNAYVTGFTQSFNFPTTPGAFDTSGNVSEFFVIADAFVTKLGPTGSAPLLYSTFLGGSGGFDEGYAIAVDGAGNAYVTGYTQSADFPTTPGAFDTTLDGVQDAFVTGLVPTGGAPLLYSTYLGGAGGDGGFGIAVAGTGNAYVTGSTTSTDFPTTADAFDMSLDGGGDAFVTKLDPSGAMPYSTYLGGSSGDGGAGIAIDGAGNAYVTGSTNSGDFPTTPGAFDQTLGGGSSDAFVTKLSTAVAPVPATLSVSPAEDTNPVGTSHTVTATVTDSDGNPVENITARFTVAGSVSASGSCTTDASGQCGFTYQGPDFPDADTITAYADTNANGVQDAGEPGASATKVWALPASTPGEVHGAGLLGGNAGEHITFGFHARNTLSGPRGSCHFDRHLSGPDDTVRCLNVTALIVIGNMATIYGDAVHNGQSTTYRITARENDKPTPDEVAITTASGFSVGGPLEHGEVKVKD